MLLGIIPILLLTFAGSYLFNKKVSSVLPVTNFFIIGTIYISGLFQKLNYGFYLVILLSVVSLIFSLYMYIKTKNVKNILTSGSVYIVCAILFAYLRYKNTMLYSWDEFSHWALVIKNMYIHNTFGNLKEATTTFKGYPPAMSIFNYFFVKASGNYREDVIQIGNLFFNLSLFSIVFTKVKRFKLGLGLCITGIVLIIVSLLMYYLDFSLLVDVVLGLIAGYVLCVYFIDNTFSKFKMLNIGLALLTLVITKESGLAFACFISIPILIDLIFFKKRINIKNRLAMMSTMISAIIISRLSWITYLKATSPEVVGAWDTSKLTLKNIWNFIVYKTGPSYSTEFQTNFMKSLYSKIEVSPLWKINQIEVLVVIYLLFIIFYSITPKKFRYKVILIWFGCILTRIIYNTSLFFVYLFSFSEYEALKLASLGRYMTTYFIMVFPLLLFFIFSFMRARVEKINSTTFNKFMLWIGSVLCLFILIVTSKVNNKPFYVESKIQRLDFKMNLDKLKSKLNPNDKIYFISQMDEGLRYHIAKYELTPNFIQPNLATLGNPHDGEDIWSRNLSVNELKEELKDYDYLYLDYVDLIFLDKYSDLFPEELPVSNSAYKIDTTNDKEIKLVKLYTLDTNNEVVMKHDDY